MFKLLLKTRSLIFFSLIISVNSAYGSERNASAEAIKLASDIAEKALDGYIGELQIKSMSRPDFPATINLLALNMEGAGIRQNRKDMNDILIKELPDRFSIEELNEIQDNLQEESFGLFKSLVFQLNWLSSYCPPDEDKSENLEETADETKLFEQVLNISILDEESKQRLLKGFRSIEKTSGATLNYEERIAKIIKFYDESDSNKMFPKLLASLMLQRPIPLLRMVEDEEDTAQPPIAEAV